MRQIFRNRILLSLLAVLISSVTIPAVAQDTAAQLAGTVLDGSGAAVAHAHLTITANNATGMKKQTDSDGTGGLCLSRTASRHLLTQRKRKRLDSIHSPNKVCCSLSGSTGDAARCSSPEGRRRSSETVTVTGGARN